MRRSIKKSYGKVLINLIGIIIVFIGILSFTNFQVNAFSISERKKITNNENEYDSVDNLVLYSNNEDERLINIKIEGISEFDDVYCIENANYFLNNPKHAENSEEDNSLGTCTTVAMQMLLGYHNYYSDRRLIPEFNNDNERFLSENYGNLLDHPSINSEVGESYGKESIGTLDTLYQELLDMIVLSDVPGIGQTVLSINVGANKFVAEYAKEIKDTVSITNNVYYSKKVLEDLNEGRPVILQFDKISLGDIAFHTVVAYGYAKYNGVDGYIVHCGWQSGDVFSWVPASWIGYQIRMDINHEHTYIDSGEVVAEIYKKNVCIECGCEKLECIYDVNEEGNAIVGVKEVLNSNITIPTKIFNNNIETLARESFKDNYEINNVIIPNSIKYIEAGAFENCINLEEVQLSRKVTTIQENTFKGCTSLTKVTNQYGVEYIEAGAFENCINLQSFTLPENLVSIGASAFKGCNSLESIVLQEDIQLIDDYAFENCSNLNSVIVEREVSNLINIGVDIFKRCSEMLTIIVPQGRIAEYKNNWIAYSNQIIPDDENYTQIDLSCHSIVEDVITLKGSYKAIYQLNIYCNKSYKITFDSDMDVEINLYDSNMHLISNYKNEIISYLGKGIYYIDIEILTEPITKVINAKFCLRWSNNGEGINCNQELDALLHLHKISTDSYANNLYFENSDGPGFYKFQLNGIFTDGSSIEYKEGTISVYEDSERTSLLNKLPNYSFAAKSSENQNTLFVYLPRNGKFYIQIISESNDYEYLNLLVTPAEEAIIHLLPDMLSAYNDDLISNSILEENVLKLEIRQTSKYLMTLTSNGELNNDFNILILKHKYEDNKYVLENKEINYVSSSNLNMSYEISLTASTYFIYYYGNSNNSNITLNLNRLIINNSSMSYVIQADPAGYNPGSEVKFNNGDLNDYIITGGFTRNLYFIKNAFSTSRLAYDWYSSNETIASVSAYGTVLANNVLSEQVITIYAVYRDNPSIVYYRIFTIVEDTSEEILEINLDVEYSYTDTNGIYQIQLNENNSPYPWLQYYGWTVYVPCQENEIICSINQWGEFSASGAGYATVTGVYLLNPRVRIVINFKILE